MEHLAAISRPHSAPTPPTWTDQTENFGRVAANPLGVGDRLVAGWKTILPAMYPAYSGRMGRVESQLRMQRRSMRKTLRRLPRSGSQDSGSQ